MSVPRAPQKLILAIALSLLCQCLRIGNHSKCVLICKGGISAYFVAHVDHWRHGLEPCAAPPGEKGGVIRTDKANKQTRGIHRQGSRILIKGPNFLRTAC